MQQKSGLGADCIEVLFSLFPRIWIKDSSKSLGKSAIAQEQILAGCRQVANGLSVHGLT
jgi:hypothetical protein